MSKKTLLKSIIAVSAATTMLISSTVFAEVTTTTRYVLGSDLIEVSTVVTELAEKDQVTYLAGSISDPIYFDQKTVADGETSVEFNYRTDKAEANVVGKAITVAKSDSTFENGSVVTNDGSETIPAAGKFVFNVKLDTSDLTPIYVNPNDIGQKVTVDLTSMDATKTVDKVEVNGTSVEFILGDGNVSITHGITLTSDANTGFTPESANIVITTKDIEVKTYEAPVFYQGFKTDSYTHDFGGERGEVNGKMFAIYGTSDSYPAGSEFGIAVSYTDEFDEDSSSEAYTLYPSAALTAGNYDFAVAIIDPENETTYAYYRTYYKDAQGNVVFGGIGKVTFN